MDEHKIQYFEQEGGRSFPWFRVVSPVECAALRGRIAEKVGVPLEADPLKLVLRVAEKEGRNLPQSAEDEHFDLAQVIATAGIEPRDLVHLNWYRFDRIEQMGLADLIDYFDEIWYPGSDDLDIFDETVQWILSISHHGAVRVLFFEE